MMQRKHSYWSTLGALALLVGSTQVAALDKNVLRAGLEGDANEEISRLRDAGNEYDAPPVYDYVQRVLDDVSQEPGRYQVFLLDTEDVIGYALSNGNVVLSSALVARLENEAQLAMVLAHELAHIEKEHALEVKVAEIERENRRSGGSFGDLLSRAGDLAVATGAISSITGGDTSTVTEGVSTANTANVALESIESSMAAAGPEGLGKELEEEADKRGVKLLSKSGYDLNVAVTAWEQLAKYSVNTSSRYLYGNTEALAERSKQTREAADKRKSSGSKGTEHGAYCEEIFVTARWLATEDIDAKRFKAAEDSVGCALAARPDDPRTRYLNGMLLRETARTSSGYRAAIDEFKFVLNEIPDQASTHRELGYTYTDVEEYDLALNHLGRYLELRPDAKDKDNVESAIEAVETLKSVSGGGEDW